MPIKLALYAALTTALAGSFLSSTIQGRTKKSYPTTAKGLSEGSFRLFEGQFGESIGVIAGAAARSLFNQYKDTGRLTKRRKGQVSTLHLQGMVCYRKRKTIEVLIPYQKKIQLLEGDIISYSCHFTFDPIQGVMDQPPPPTNRGVTVGNWMVASDFIIASAPEGLIPSAIQSSQVVWPSNITVDPAQPPKLIWHNAFSN